MILEIPDRIANLAANLFELHSDLSTSFSDNNSNWIISVKINQFFPSVLEISNQSFKLIIQEQELNSLIKASKK